jgi:hypothetical protein
VKGLEVEENPSSPRYRRASKALLSVFMQKNLVLCDLYTHTHKERERERERARDREREREVLKDCWWIWKLINDCNLLIKYQQAKSF